MDDEQIRLFAARAIGEETTPEPDPVELDREQTIEFLAHVHNLDQQVSLAWPDAKVWIAALDLCERIFQDYNIELDDETVYKVLLGRRDAKRYPTKPYPPLGAENSFGRLLADFGGKMEKLRMHVSRDALNKSGFVCVGDVRGWCGHVHRSQEAAERCIGEDQAGCRAQGGYSDRRVFDLDAL